ncbi:MAG TPA: outer membrane beta-barrel protein, partial [Bryobacteraceae bacterium]|nr:outer membrane beta-barrel protein [Bryobacteraceae bacterium]
MLRSTHAVLPRLVVLAMISSSLVGQTPAKTNATAPLTDRERMLLVHVADLEKRVEALEKKLAVANVAPATPKPDPPVNAPAAASPSNSAAPEQAASPVKVSEPVLPPTFLDGTTLNLTLDTYYGYNFNDPIGRVNLLRAYDVSSNAVSLNQAGLILDNEPDVHKGKRWGFRLDFQYGQATESLQGNSLNEPRPEIYRNIFQAYGTYSIPIGRGLRVDVGKFASSLGIEGTYTKDQMNYSRSLWFTALPFYHMGLRANYAVNNVVAVNYWLVNGTQQTEPFNGYKDEFFGLTITPSKKLTWNVNYYLGQEHP